MKNSSDLSSILIDLQDRLSDNDRQRFDIYLKNNVSQSILNEILKLIQSLLHQNKINEKDLHLLIDGFKQIQCFDAAHLLTEHQHRMISNGLKQSIQSLASIMPSRCQQYQYNYGSEYQDDPNSLLLNEINCNNNTNNASSINMMTINKDSRRQWFSICLIKYKYFLISLILIILAILIFIFIRRNYCMIHLKKNPSINQSCILEVKKQSNHVLLAKNETSEQLNETLTEIKQENKITSIKAGRKFGGPGGGDFDDSLLPMFTYFHYLNGFIIFDINNFDSCQFMYTSFQENRTQIESNTYGWHVSRINRTQKYQLDVDERIEKVEIKSSNKTYSGHDGSSFTLSIITAWKFTTTKGRSIPPNLNLTGNGVEVEFYPGYTVGYVTGNAGSKIDQLQFFWYRTER